jgi:hypothetical protein
MCISLHKIMYSFQFFYIYITNKKYYIMNIEMKMENNNFRKFGIEYEFCFKTKYNKIDIPIWYNNVLKYIDIIRKNYNSNNDIQFIKWVNSFNLNVKIQDDDNKYYDFYLNNYDNPQEINNYINKYTTPVITLDSTVKCHNNTKRNKLHNYNLPNFEKIENQNYSINIEIISQIFKNINEFDYFMYLFFNNVNMYINKSQGVHLNINVSDLNYIQIRDIIVNKYKAWENQYSYNIRPFPSNYSKLLSKNKINLLNKFNILKLNIKNILTKTDSVKYKNNLKLLEFRIFTPYDKKLKEHILDLLNWFPKYEYIIGGLFTRKKIKRYFKGKNTFKKRIIQTSKND